MQAHREREFVNDFLEELRSARITYNYRRIGGFSHDIPNESWKERVLERNEHFLPRVDEFDRLITYNEVFVQRCANIAVISAQKPSTGASSAPTFEQAVSDEVSVATT